MTLIEKNYIGIRNFFVEIENIARILGIHINQGKKCTKGDGKKQFKTREKWIFNNKNFIHLKDLKILII
jgi:hypothetical protein